MYVHMYMHIHLYMYMHMQADGPDILQDDVVRVIDDIAEVHRLQKDGRGWEDDMALVSGDSKLHVALYFGVSRVLFPLPCAYTAVRP